MNIREFKAVIVLALGVGLAGASLANDTAAAPKPAKAFVYLSSDEFDPLRVLPPPPAEGGERQMAELREVRRAYDAADPARRALAQWDNDHEDPSLFAPALGPNFDMTKLPKTAALLAIVQHEASTASARAKKAFKRTRPWAEDRELQACDAADHDAPDTSYPSGHSTIGYALATVLASVMPDRAAVIQDRAFDYAYSREICGDHYPSDTEASHVLGTRVALRLLTDARLSEALSQARAELIAAGLTK